MLRIVLEFSLQRHPRTHTSSQLRRTVYAEASITDEETGSARNHTIGDFCIDAKVAYLLKNRNCLGTPSI
jgi:hypothetical protein